MLFTVTLKLYSIPRTAVEMDFFSIIHHLMCVRMCLKPFMCSMEHTKITTLFVSYFDMSLFLALLETQ